MEKKIFSETHEAHSYSIWYVAMSSGLLHKACQSSPLGSNWPILGINEIPESYNEKKKTPLKIFFS